MTRFSYALVLCVLLTAFPAANAGAVTVLYSISGFVEHDDVDNPWGLAGDGSCCVTPTDGTPFTLRVGVEINAVDQFVVADGFALFDTVAATLTLDGQTARVLGSSGLRLRDNDTPIAPDMVTFQVDARFRGVTLNLLTTAIIAGNSFALLAQPGGADEVPVFASTATLIAATSTSVDRLVAHLPVGSPLTVTVVPLPGALLLFAAALAATGAGLGRRRI